MYQRKKYVASNYLGNGTTRTQYICRSPFVIVTLCIVGKLLQELVKIITLKY